MDIPACIDIKIIMLTFLWFLINIHWNWSRTPISKIFGLKGGFEPPLTSS